MLNGVILLFAAVIVIFIISALNHPGQNDITYLDPAPVNTEAAESRTPDLNLLEEKNLDRQVSVRLLNGCGVSGVAGTIRDELIRQGIDVVQTANADHFQYEKTIVYLHTDSYAKTVYVADALGVPNHPIMDDRTPDFACDMTVIIGKDYKNLKPIKE